MNSVYLRMQRSAAAAQRRRRGHSSVEYAVTLAVVISATVAIAYLGNQVFTPIHSTGGLFDAGGESATAVSAHSSGIIGNEREVDTYVLGALILICVSSTFFVGSLLRPSKRRAHITHVDTEPQEQQVKADPGAKLRNVIFEKRDILLSEMTEDLGHVLDGHFEVSHLMSTKMKVVAEDRSAEEVRRTMRKNRMHHLLVCDGTKLIGVISDRDLVKTHAKTAGQLMTRDPISVSPDHLLIPTVSTMINKRISCLPVAEDGELKGVLTRTDLLLAFQCVMQIMTRIYHDGDESGKLPIVSTDSLAPAN